MKKQMYRTIQQLKVALIDNPKDVIMSPETIKFNMVEEDMKYILPYMQKSHIRYVCKCVYLTDEFILKNINSLDINNILCNKIVAKELKLETIDKIIKYQNAINANIFRNCSLNFDFLVKYQDSINYNLMLMNPNISIKDKIPFISCNNIKIVDIREITKLEFSCLLGKFMHEKNYSMTEYYNLIESINPIYYYQSIILSVIIELNTNSKIIKDMMRYKIGIFDMPELRHDLDKYKYRMEYMIEKCDLFKNAARTYVLRDSFITKHFDKLNANDLFKYQLENITSSQCLKKLMEVIDGKQNKIVIQNKLIKNMTKLFKNKYITSKAHQSINLFKINNTILSTNIYDNVFIDLGNGTLMVTKSDFFKNGTIIAYDCFINFIYKCIDKLCIIFDSDKSDFNKNKETLLKDFHNQDYSKKSITDPQMFISKPLDNNKTVALYNGIEDNKTFVKGSLEYNIDRKNKILNALEKCDYGFVEDEKGEFICIKARRKIINTHNNIIMQLADGNEITTIIQIISFEDSKFIVDNVKKIIEPLDNEQKCKTTETKRNSMTNTIIKEFTQEANKVQCKPYHILSANLTSEQSVYNLDNEVTILYNIICSNKKENRNIFVDYENGFGFCISSMNDIFESYTIYSNDIIEQCIEEGYEIEIISKCLYESLNTFKTQSIAFNDKETNIVILKNNKIVFRA